MSELRDRPAGTVRITAGDHPVATLLWPKLAKFLPAYPDLEIEIVVDTGLTDIVAGRYDAGVRLGEQFARDMVTVRIGPEIRFVVVGAGVLRAAVAADNAARPDRPSLLNGIDWITAHCESCSPW